MQHLNALTSLRFFAAMAVFFSHCGFMTGVGSEKLDKLYGYIFHEGFLGVGFFFILSGYILAYSYGGRLLSGKVSKRSFYIARIARIYPLHLITLLCALPLLYFQVKQVGGWALSVLPAHLLLVQSFIPSHHFYFALNGPSWSISVELFFYLLFPFVILLSSKKLVTLASLVFLGLWLFIYNADKTFLESYGRWTTGIFPLLQVGNFILGIVLYRLFGDFKKYSFKVVTYMQCLSVVLLVLFYVMFPNVSIYYRYSVYYILPFALLVVSFSNGQGWLSKLIDKKRFILLGHASFAFYLVHQLIIKYGELIVEKVFDIPFLLSPEGTVVRVIFYLVLSYSISIVLHLKFEMQAKSWVQKKFAGVIK
ncbi:MAG: acyltransferase [Fibrobacterales bacterium]